LAKPNRCAKVAAAVILLLVMVINPLNGWN
jgi:hypothetical protein